MDGYLKVNYADGVESQYPLVNEATRVGGDDLAELVVDGLPSPALIVVKRNEKVTVINRACDCLRLGMRRVPLNEATTWKWNQAAVVNDLVTIRLMRGRPAPEKAAKPETWNGEEASLGAEQHESRCKTLLLAFLLVVLTAGLALSSAAIGSQDDGTVAFEQLVARVQRRDHEVQEYMRIVYEARIEEHWGNVERSKELYMKLRNQLLQACGTVDADHASMARGRSSDSDAHERQRRQRVHDVENILRYVESCITRIGS